jgi:hypothetical protein
VSERLPRAVRALIRDHVHSVGELDLLMLLHAQSDRIWTAEDVSATLGAPVAWAATQLQRLEAAGLLVGDDNGWRSRPQPAAQRDALDALDALHRTRRRDLVRYVFAQKPGTADDGARP